MKITIDLPDLKEVIAETIETVLIDKQAKLFRWKFFSLKEAAELLQVKPSTLLDKRQFF